MDPHEKTLWGVLREGSVEDVRCAEMVGAEWAEEDVLDGAEGPGGSGELSLAGDDGQLEGRILRTLSSTHATRRVP